MNTLNMLFIGRPTRAKGLPDLCDALAGLMNYNWTLRIIGEPPNWLPHRNPGILQRCRIMGKICNKTIPAFLRKADVVTIPSRYENFCNVGLEALASGTPVIGSRCGGISDLVESGVNGFLFDPGNVSMLRSVLKRILESPGCLSAMGEHSRKKAKLYHWENIAAATSRLLFEISRQKTIVRHSPQYVKIQSDLANRRSQNK